MPKLRNDDPRRRGVLTSPVRIELFECLARRGPASVAELARAMGRSADSLYYHVHLLVDAGVVVVKERRRTGRRDESVFAAAVERLEMVCDPKSEASVRIEERGLRALLRLVERTYTRALRGGKVHTGGKNRDLFALRIRTTLDAEARGELNRRVEELWDFLREHADEGRGRPTTLTLIAAPIPD